MRRSHLLILIFLGALFVAAAFLRFYRLGEYIQFLGDEGRDALVVKRMIVDHEWTLLGPNASVGGFYTGPIYYYFMIPFLALWQLDPVGPAVMSALIGLATLAVLYYFCSKVWNRRVALMATTIAALSPKLIEISRYSWNPNPIPLFTILVVLFLYLAQVKKKSYFVLLAGIGLGIMVQLHYSGLVFTSVVGAAILLTLPRNKIIINGIMATLGFLIGESMFLAFEMRHGYPNIRTAFEFFTRGNDTISGQFDLLGTSRDVVRRLYEIILGFRGPWLSLIAISSLLATGWWVLKSWSTPRRKKALLILFWFALATLGTGAYRGQRLDHYFMFLFLLPPIFVAVLGDLLWKRVWTRVLVLIGLIGIIYMELAASYLWQRPNNLVAQTQAVDKIVLELAGEDPYNFAVIAPGNSDHAYRYFQEIWGRPAVVIQPPEKDAERVSITDQLIVVCEQRDCSPLGYSLWEVAGFGRADIVEMREGPAGIKVFKLIHYTGT